eukprot:2764066-Karenia_brevis.AAC.1
MAVYSNIDEYKSALQSLSFPNRATFQEAVYYAKIQQLETPYMDEPTTRAILFCQKFGLVPSQKICPCEGCNSVWTLCVKMQSGNEEGATGNARWDWLGPR